MVSTQVEDTVSVVVAKDSGGINIYCSFVFVTYIPFSSAMALGSAGRLFFSMSPPAFELAKGGS